MGIHHVGGKLVNGYGKFTQPNIDSFGHKMIGRSNGSDRQSHSVTVHCDSHIQACIAKHFLGRVTSTYA